MPADSAADLEKILHSSLDKAAELKVVLEAERDALASADAEALQEAALEKRRSVQALETLEAARARIVRQAGFDTAPESMADIANCLPGSGVTDTWNRYLLVAKECSELNARNGAVINMRRSQIHQTLSLLRHGRAESGTYGPAGQAPNTLGSRTLTEA